jgi:hypothetical protein
MNKLDQLEFLAIEMESELKKIFWWQFRKRVVLKKNYELIKRLIEENKLK